MLGFKGVFLYAMRGLVFAWQARGPNILGSGCELGLSSATAAHSVGQ